MKNNMYVSVRTFLAGLALMSASQTFAQFTWGSAGPIFTSGRARNMVVDKNNASTLYVGSASGGVFKSTDAGANWAPLDDQGRVRNISYMAQAINGDVYAATGEGFLRYSQKSKAQVGTGLYKVSGNSMIQMAPATITGTMINRIACSPTDANKIAIASNLGILISTDGGSTFTKAAMTPSLIPNVSYGMDVKFDSNGILYCSSGNERGHGPPGPNFAAVASQVWKSDASLSVFANITPTANSISGLYGRIELAVAPSNANVVYASCANKNISTTTSVSPSSASMKALFISTDAGSSWQLLAQGASQFDPLTNGGSVATGDYAHVLVVNPADPYMLFMGGYAAYVYFGSAANPTGGNWSAIGSRFAINTPYYLHENIHDIKIVPGSPNKIYFITDAGIYRSTDLVSTSVLPSFQAIYKGFVTGQFNSVSVQRFPVTVGHAAQGQSVTPNFGYIGGTGGNGMVYYSGTSSLVTQENSFVGGEVYNAEFSKHLPDAALLSSGNGALYRTSNVKSAQPQIININTYLGPLNDLTPKTGEIANSNVTTGAGFELWENVGLTSNPDSVFFFNDSLPRHPYSFSGGVQELTTRTTFTFSAPRPNRFARIDSIAIRTATVEVPAGVTKIPEGFSGADKKDIFINLKNENNPPVTTITVVTLGDTTQQNIQVFKDTNLDVVGPADVGTNRPIITLNNTTLFDNISVTFTSPPFAAKTTPTYAGVPDPALYYRVFATLYYRYMPGDSITVVDNNITTKSATYTAVLTNSLSWQYGSGAARAALDGSLVPFPKYNRPVGIPVKASARLAMCLNGGPTGNQPAVVISKAPLNLNDPMNIVRIAQSGALADSSNGDPSRVLKTFFLGRPFIVKWAKSGTELYFATTSTTENKLFRVSHITRIMDMGQSSYNGKFSTDVFKYIDAFPSSGVNFNSPYRTTCIGQFTKPITSIQVSDDNSKIVVTVNAAATGTATGSVYYSKFDVRKYDVTNQVWDAKDAGFTDLTGKSAYCSLMEMSDNKKVFVGTDVGLVYTNNIEDATPTWVSANNNQLPSVQIFDIEQQTLNNADTYNSGEIYVATNGRGVWSSRSFFNPMIVGVEEQEEQVSITAGHKLLMFPNPASSDVNLIFTAVEGENASIQVFDLSGRQVASQQLGRLNAGEGLYTFDASQLNKGIYLLNISSDSGIKRVSKLVISK
jgi:hypothetical protein